MTAARATAAHRALPPAERVRLVAEILRIYVRARRLLRTTSLPAVLEDLRGDPVSAHERPVSAAEGRRLGRAVVRTLSLLPTDSRCLTRSLVLIALLTRRGTPSRLVLGVTGAEGFAAHAWVELDGRPLLEPGTDFERLTEL